jgi:hypothetical protein
MNKLLLITLALLQLNITYVNAQNRLVLEHSKKARRKKVVNFNDRYEIRTADTTYVSQIVSFTDSSLTVTAQVKTGRDSAYTYTVTGRVNKRKSPFSFQGTDTTYTYTIEQPVYRQDSTVVLFTDIQMIKKDWFQNRRWAEGFAWLSLGPIIGAGLWPVAVIDEGSKGLKDWAVFEAIGIGICGPPLFIATRKSRYNLKKKKWILKTEQ